MKWTELTQGERYVVKPPYKKERIATLIGGAPNCYEWIVEFDGGEMMQVRSQAIRRVAPPPTGDA